MQPITSAFYLTIDASSLVNTSIGLEMTGNITISAVPPSNGFGGKTYQQPFQGVYHASQHTFIIQNRPNPPSGYTFEINFYVTPQGDLTTIPAGGGPSNFFINAGSDFDQGNDVQAPGRWVVLNPNPSGNP